MQGWVGACSAWNSCLAASLAVSPVPTQDLKQTCRSPSAPAGFFLFASPGSQLSLHGRCAPACRSAQRARAPIRSDGLPLFGCHALPKS